MVATTTADISDKPSDALKLGRRAAMRQPSPNVWVPARTGLEAPDYTLCMWRQEADGTYRPVPLVERLIRVTEPVLRALGLPRGGMKTLQRLGRSGFIELVQGAPRSWLLNLDSWFGHLKRVAEDPEFWDDGRGNIEEYRKSL